jgi:hypothetical protein
MNVQIPFLKECGKRKIKNGDVINLTGINTNNKLENEFNKLLEGIDEHTTLDDVGFTISEIIDISNGCIGICTKNEEMLSSKVVFKNGVVSISIAKPTEHHILTIQTLKSLSKYIKYTSLRIIVGNNILRVSNAENIDGIVYLTLTEKMSV